MDNETKQTDLAADVTVPAEKTTKETVAAGKSKGNKRRYLTRKIAVTGVFTALSYGLYLLGKFCKLPFMFPSFFDLQFSELPALIASFVLGPVYGAAVVILKCLLKMPMSGTAMVGEATDIILGLMLVVPAGLIYRRKRDIRGALLGVVVGSVCNVAAAVAVNRYISIPFYLTLFFKGNQNALLNMMRPLFPAITWSNFYAYYLGLSVVPFNLLRCVIMCILTFALYKRLSGLIRRFVGESSRTAKAKPVGVHEKASLGFVLTKRQVAGQWSALILSSALIIVIMVGLWICLR